MEDSITQDLTHNYYYQNLKEEESNETNFIYILNAILSGTARLNVLLPTATILGFTIFAPLLSNDGRCTALNRWMMGSFLIFLATSCVFFTFTDSFRTAKGRLYYGVATLSGIWTFNVGRKKPCIPSDYRLRWSDLFHAGLSLVAITGSHGDVVACYYPGVPRKVTNVVPMVVRVVVSVLFVVFPSRRRGVGYPFLLHSEARSSSY
ncbi:hypothetical protein V6N13_004671 [Hibiscus sabdariffa]|uniref:Uncharacterized protein n=1 Tax=Hibiscus sabdariffa TaxID=183260 RepID=A0ABR2RZP6_9ROSI